MEIRRRPPNPKVKVAHLEYAIPHEESEPRNILEKIVWEKDREVASARDRVTLEQLKKQVAELPATRDFLAALKAACRKPAVIAEVKKASPSKGVMREDFDPVAITQGDFILSPYQLYQARAAGADAALLIAAILTDADMAYLLKVARALGLTVLVEVHDAAELERVLALEGVQLIGINNRNLATFDTDLATTEQLTERYGEQIRGKGCLLVSESGLLSRDDLDRVQSAGADAVLVGESLMRQSDVTAALEMLING